MSFLHIVRLLLAVCACICSGQAHTGHGQLHGNDVEAWARRDYFYVGGQYVQTTLVCPFL
jgi:hypothetical protein